MRALEHKIPPPLVAILVASAMWGASTLGPFMPLAPIIRHLVTAALAVAGISFDVLGLVAFRRAKTTMNPLRPGKASALVTAGVYQVTRNPMYVGLVLVMTAWAVHLSSLWPFLGPLLFVLYMNRFQIAPEERFLRSLFGKEYAAYAARVPRWL
jgi:protein-S-isoprenylcysteine O-methyltransferase Ste14